MPRPEDIEVPMSGSAQKKREMDYANRTSSAYYKLDATLRELVGKALPDAMRGAEVKQYLIVLDAMETLKLPDNGRVEMAKQLLARMGEDNFLRQCRDIGFLNRVCQGIARVPGGVGMQLVTPELMKQLRNTVSRLAALSMQRDSDEQSRQQQQQREGRGSGKGGKGADQQQEQRSKGKVHMSLKRGQQSRASGSPPPDLGCAPDQLAAVLAWMLRTPPVSDHSLPMTALSTLQTGCSYSNPSACCCSIGTCHVDNWVRGMEVQALFYLLLHHCRTHKKSLAMDLSRQHGMQ
jgi:hypothetical protein